MKGRRVSFSSCVLLLVCNLALAENIPELTRARRQTVKSLPRLRHPRQLIFPFGQFGSQDTGRFRPHGRRNFVHFGNSQPIVAFQEVPKSSGPSEAPQTSPDSGPSVSPTQVITVTQPKLPGPVQVTQKSDDFEHLHSFEDGRGNFQFFQLGKRKEEEVRLGSQSLRPTANFFPTPLPQSQNEISVEQAEPDNGANNDEDFIFQPTVSPSQATATTAFRPTVTPGQVSSRRIEITQDPRQPRTSFTPSTQPFFAGTALPIRQLPRVQAQNQPQFQFQGFQPNQQFQPTQPSFPAFQPPTPSDTFSNPEQPAALPFQANTNSFAPGIANPLIPANTALLTGSNNLGLQLFQPSSFPLEQSRAPINPTIQSPQGPFQRQKSQPLDQPQPTNTNLFLGTPRPQDVRQLPHFPQMNLHPSFRSSPPIPKQFMPVLSEPTFAKTRHLPEPRIINKTGGKTPVFKVENKDESQENKDEEINKSELSEIEMHKTRLTIPNTKITETARTQPRPFVQQPRTPLISFNALSELQTKRPFFQNPKQTTTTPRPTAQTTSISTTKRTTRSTTTSTTTTTTATTRRSTTKRIPTRRLTTRSTTQTSTTSRFQSPNFHRFSATMKPIIALPPKPQHFTAFSTKPPLKKMEMKMRHMQPPKQENPIQSQIHEPESLRSNLIVNHQNVVGPNFQTTTVFAPNSNTQQDANLAPVSPAQQNFRQNSFNPINQASLPNTQADIIPMQAFPMNPNSQHVMTENTHSFTPTSRINPRPLHVFAPEPVIQQQKITGPAQNVGLAQTVRKQPIPAPAQNTGTAQDFLSQLSPKQLETLRQQLNANIFPQRSSALNQQLFNTNFDQNQITSQKPKRPPPFPSRVPPKQMESFRSKPNPQLNLGAINNQQFRRPETSIPTNPTGAATTTTSSTPTTTTTTTKRPINFHLKSRERMRHRGRKRGRNPKSSRTTSKPAQNKKSDQPSFNTVNRRTEHSEKPNLFDPFNRVSRLEPMKKEFNLDTSLESAQSFAHNQVRDQSASQSKMSAFENLLAIANDKPIATSESTTEAVPSTTSTNIALISLGEGGLMPQIDTNKLDDEDPKSNKVNKFEFFTPRSMEKDVTRNSFGLSTTMGTPLVPAFDDDYPNFVLISSTSPPRIISTSAPKLTFRDSPSRSTTTTTAAATERKSTSLSSFQFAPTPMPKSKEDLHVFSFQPTPMSKRFKLRPSPKSRTFQLPKEAFRDNSISNEIDNFSPKFVVDPDMKEKFAIVKVKNHNRIETENVAEAPTPVEKERSKPKDVSTTTPTITTFKPRDRVRSLLSKNPLRKRGRFIKKIKSPKSALRSKPEPGKNKRRRLQFIRRVTLMPKLLNTQRERGESPKVPKQKEVSVLTEAANAIDAGNSLLQINAEARKNEVVADAKVAELANNILELKAKLEQLKKELQV